jgi:REP-associated tyrosine transposase
VPRAPRVFVDGACYHVYGRIARGEMIFRDRWEAARFLEVLRGVKERDGLTVFAWCVMGNHYHIALRTARVALWRSIRLVQWRFARQHNRKLRQLGPVWQGRYQVRMVMEDRYLVQLIAYIHLNPVSAGLVNDPSAYRWSGHRELLGGSEEPLADIDATLTLFGRQRAAARRAYVRMLRGERGQPWVGEQPGRLPWWGRGGDEDVDGSAWEPARSEGARGVGERRSVRDVDGFIRRAARELGVASEELRSRRKAPATVRAREIIAIVGVERFGVKVAELADRLNKNPGSVSRWIVEAGERRQQEREFAADCERLEASVWGGGSGHQR